MQDTLGATMYGLRRATQPTQTDTMDHAPGTPEPRIQTVPNGPTPAGLDSPMLVLVLLVALALVVVNVGFKFSVQAST